jgi:hypothetical protein
LLSVCLRSIPQIQRVNSGEPFTISTKVIRKRLAAIGKNKPVGPDSVSGEILKLGGEAMNPYLARILYIIINYNNNKGARGSVVVKALCYKQEGCGFKSR